MYLALLDTLMADAEASGNWESGLAYGRRALTEDRANERSYVRMMRLHCRAGNRTEALRQYDGCVTALREELGVAPEASTQTLYELIRDKGRIDSLRGPDSALSSGRPLRADSAATSSDDSLHRLRELNRSLTQLQEQLAGEIRALESA
jgi:DNA-binding SARP family transcriptional activator